MLRLFAPDWLEYRMKFINAGEQKGFGSDANWKIDYKNDKFYSFTPNSTFSIYHQEYENTVNVNRLGGRMSEVNENIDTNAILPFTGDSFVMGVGVEDTQTIVALAKRGLKLNFINLGLAGTGLPQQREIINIRAKDFTPSTVVFGFYLQNDFPDILDYRAKQSAGGTKDTSARVEPASPAPAKSATSNGQGLAWKLNYFINNNALFRHLYFVHYLKQKLMNIMNKDKEVKQVDPMFWIMDKSNTAYIEKLKIALDDEMSIQSRQPYRSVFVLFPDKLQLIEENRINSAKYYNINVADLDPLLPNKLITTALAKYNIPFIDPTACMMRYGNKKELYYINDGHFTPKGTEVCYQCIDSALKQILTHNNNNINGLQKQ